MNIYFLSLIPFVGAIDEDGFSIIGCQEGLITCSATNFRVVNQITSHGKVYACQHNAIQNQWVVMTGSGSLVT